MGAPKRKPGYPEAQLRERVSVNRQYLVAQLGSRRDYAVPAVLARAGILQHFYTDVCGNMGFGKWASLFGAVAGFTPAKRLAARRLPSELLSRTRLFPAGSMLYEFDRWLARGDPLRDARALRKFGERSGKSMSRTDFSRCTHLYTMLGEVTPLLEAAKRRRNQNGNRNVHCTKLRKNCLETTEAAPRARRGGTGQNNARCVLLVRTSLLVDRFVRRPL